MLKASAFEMVNRDCPICDKVHDVEKHIENAVVEIKGEMVEYVAEFFVCPSGYINGENSWAPAGMFDRNLLRARDAYRVKHNLLTSEEIIGIRKKYRMSQRELSNLLGWGNVTISRYETSHIQDETYDGLIRMVAKNPTFALEMLTKHQNLFAGDRFLEIKSLLKSIIKAEGNVELKRQTIRNHYIDFDIESDANGFKLLDINKVADAIAYFANHVKNLYKVKLMKLLWYTDVLSFNRNGKSMTGLVYLHKALGALPLAHNEITHLPTVNVIEEETEAGTSYNIVPLEKPQSPAFSLEELEILTKVALKFKDMSGKEISDYMHKEEAHKNTKINEIIYFSKVRNIAPF